MNIKATKNMKFIKKIIALTAAICVACILSVSAFAASTCTYDSNGKPTGVAAGSDAYAICSALGKMYGTNESIPYNEGTSTNELTYALTVTTESGAKTVYVGEKTTINDVGVAVGNDGKLNVTGMGTGDSNTWNQIFAKYKDIIVGISGVATITFVVFFIINIVKVGQNAANPNGRSSAIQGVIWTGIAAALLGSVTIIAGFFYNAI